MDVGPDLCVYAWLFHPTLAGRHTWRPFVADYLDVRIKRGDASIFTIITALSQADKAVFLELQNIVGSLHPGYCYLEVGSDRGGSIIAPLFDSRCGTLVSVDPRPEIQPDERGVSFSFPENTTAKMLEILAAAVCSRKRCPCPAACLDTDISNLPFWRSASRHACRLHRRAEHLDQAVFRD